MGGGESITRTTLNLKYFNSVVNELYRRLCLSMFFFEPRESGLKLTGVGIFVAFDCHYLAFESVMMQSIQPHHELSVLDVRGFTRWHKTKQNPHTMHSRAEGTVKA